MSIRYNSGEDWFKYPFGAVKCNTEVTFRIVAEGNPFAVFFVADGETGGLTAVSPPWTFRSGAFFVP